MKNFPEVLQDLLQENRISMYKLAKDIHVSQQAVSNWCTGASEPKMSHLLKLADYFEVSLDCLVGRKEY